MEFNHKERRLIALYVELCTGKERKAPVPVSVKGCFDKVAMELSQREFHKLVTKLNNRFGYSFVIQPIVAQTSEQALFMQMNGLADVWEGQAGFREVNPGYIISTDKVEVNIIVKGNYEI